ncbi:GNAT family N-acetyltransferase [Leucobacter massiliensis]|uniref:N-acetyltransferase n=1 Tax=Leucobacter massiliensis TaxID=1686285 RepID=A0A2S9QMN7_9MICO|nr:GNAT family N-acetyltransferase [Leucobacter massiliensis]PRI10850.1 N-acetyltransferase [Leucobacter massiliensis]
MARYSDEVQAAADGFAIVHEPDRGRYALYREDSGARSLVGEAHYSLIGEDAIDFDHTVVAPALRGTGLAGLLARRALTGDAVGGRRVRASCWYVAGVIERHPELLAR